MQLSAAGIRGVRLAYYVRQARAYIGREKGLQETLRLVEESSKSIGLSLLEYVTLHRTVRKMRPTWVLECGTGKSTWVIAQAMLENERESGPHEAKLISMEHDRDWHEHALSILPDRYKDVVEICYSPTDVHGYGFIRGTVYQEVPAHPYQLVFVDGPHQYLPNQSPKMCNMDFVRLVEKSDKPITALVDGRARTLIAYALVFGPEKVIYYGDCKMGMVDSVTKNDMLLADGRTGSILFPRFVSRQRGIP